MRFKGGFPLDPKPNDLFAKQVFAWLPKRCWNGTYVWLEKIEEIYKFERNWHYGFNWFLINRYPIKPF